MKKFMLIFWGIFILYFIAVHPSIIYYNTSHYQPASQKIYALFLTSISFIAWGYIFWILFKFFILTAFKNRNTINWLLNYGEPVDAIIESVEKIALLKNAKPYYELGIRLINFSGSLIHDRISVFKVSEVDNEKFMVGKNIQLYIDKTFKKYPYYAVQTLQHNYFKTVLFVFIWCILLTILIGYYLYAYHADGKGYGWRFMEFSHPLIFCPFMFYIFYGIFLVLKRTLILNDNKYLLYHGIRTEAIITQANQTGTYVNKQPQVNISLSFQDKNGKEQVCSIKQIVPLLEIHKITQGASKTIFYLEDNPQKAGFAESLEN